MADMEKDTVSSTADDKAAQVKTDAAKPEKKKKDKVKFTDKVKRFFRDYKSEMKKIVWYSRKDTIHSTILVVVAIVISAAFIGAIDFGFSKAVMALGSIV
ncbi:MAG: preprotein translocase subunit SecE [Eubacteriales bacterium]